MTEKVEKETISRSIIQLGKNSLVVVIPRPFVEKNNLKKGQELVVCPDQENRSITYKIKVEKKL